MENKKLVCIIVVGLNNNGECVTMDFYRNQFEANIASVFFGETHKDVIDKIDKVEAYIVEIERVGDTCYAKYLEATDEKAKCVFDNEDGVSFEETDRRQDEFNKLVEYIKNATDVKWL